MAELNFDELAGEDFNPLLKIGGINNFLEEKGEDFKINYFCFSPKGAFLESVQSNEEFFTKEIFDSEIYPLFRKSCFEEFNKYHQFLYDDFEEYSGQESLALERLARYNPKMEVMTLEEKSKLVEETYLSFGISIGFLEEMFDADRRFFSSDFEIKFNEKIREEVNLYKNGFLGKKFDFKKFNNHLLGVYGLSILK